MASPLPETGDMSFDSPQFNEAVLEEVIPTRLVPKGFGKRMHPSLLSLNPRGRAVSLSSLSVNGRVNQRSPHTPSDRSKLQNSIYISDPLSTTNHLLNASLGARRPIRPLDQANYHGLRSDHSLLDVSLKIRRRADSGNYASETLSVKREHTMLTRCYSLAASKLPSVVQAASGDVSKPVMATLSALPVVVEDLSLGKKVLVPETPGVVQPLAGILGARDASQSSLLAGLPLLSDLASSLPASSAPLSHVALPSSGIPILGSLLSARAEQLEPSLEGLGELSHPHNPFSSESLSASDILAAGGAFPIQPSHSLDGQTLPNEGSLPELPELLAEAAMIRGSDTNRATQQDEDSSAKKKKHHHHPSSGPPSSGLEDDVSSLLHADLPLASHPEEALFALPVGAAIPKEDVPAAVLAARALPLTPLASALPDVPSLTTVPVLGPLLGELPVVGGLLKPRAEGTVSPLEGSDPRAVNETTISTPDALSASQILATVAPLSDPPLLVEPSVVPNFSQLLAAAATAPTGAPPVPHAEQTLRATKHVSVHNHPSTLLLDPKLLRARTLFSFPSTSS
ncbi:hypothetical protein VP01_1536g7 [Puccinia sorghi]|uniref:Uncharacterized protein n=1 Tax=Puccinia sorghi TaxID=27349 RepID=A0A0L6VIM0_9BASI|nr:hypothetical protein VP01_1536g7 [Puccinia sorghi]